MAEASRHAVLSPDARRDLRKIIAWNKKSFGPEAAARYRALLAQTVRDIEAEPLRPGSKSTPLFTGGTRTYPMALSRSRTEGTKIKVPRHPIVYRISPARIGIACILHDRRDLW